MVARSSASTNLASDSRASSTPSNPTSISIEQLFLQRYFKDRAIISREHYPKPSPLTIDYYVAKLQHRKARPKRKVLPIAPYSILALIYGLEGCRPFAPRLRKYAGIGDGCYCLFPWLYPVMVLVVVPFDQPFYDNILGGRGFWKLHLNTPSSSGRFWS